MKFFTSLFLLLTVTLFFGCSDQDSSSSARSQSVETVTAPQPVLGNQPLVTDAAGASASAGLQQHYICPNGCAGSGGAAAGTCPTCGSTYTHNAAFHNQQQQNIPTTTTTTSASSAYHYTCPNGCAGGSSAAGNCSSCGTALAHNAAYHNQGAQSTQSDPNALSPLFLDQNQQPSSSSATTITAPAQNASGTYHYICSNGCSGGSNTAGTCASCGGALAHNQAYHN